MESTGGWVPVLLIMGCSKGVGATINKVEGVINRILWEIVSKEEEEAKGKISGFQPPRDCRTIRALVRQLTPFRQSLNVLDENPTVGVLANLTSTALTMLFAALTDVPTFVRVQVP